MMKQKLLPVLAVAGGAAAFLLRLLQNRTGFEWDTGLAIPGNLPGTALILLFVVLAAAFFLLGRKTGKEDSRPFAAVFTFDDAAALTLPVAGIFLTGASGAVDLAMGLQIFPGAMFGPGSHKLLGALSIVSAVGLFLIIAACRKGSDLPAVAVLPISVALVVRLVITYRSVSTDPTLAAYYVELMALVFLTLAFFRLAGFAFADAKPRAFLLCAPMAGVFSMAAIADVAKISLPSLGAYVGGALVLLGFLMAYCPQNSTETSCEQDKN